MYRIRNEKVEIFLAHHGGPYHKDEDLGTWTIPKGTLDDGEDLFECAKREFEEETGIKPEGDFVSIGNITQKSGKVVHAWAFEKDWNGTLKENIIEIEYPYKSGKKIKIPEVDKVHYFSIEEARKKIHPSQMDFIDRVLELLKKG